jgi:hypothetical protein
MMPRPIIPADLDYWADLDPKPVTYAADDETFNECPALVTCDDTPGTARLDTVVRVPWTLNEIELAHLANGGTLWLSTWGGLPPHMLEVQEP